MRGDEVLEKDQIRERLSVVEQQFEREMRERGFDPKQADTVPLTPSLASLYDELQQLQLHLAALTDRTIMTELERITDQLQRAFEGNAWHGPSVMEVLNGVTAQQASTRVFPAGHTIWELALHIGAWERACLNRLQGHRAELTDAEDWPPVVDKSDGAWQQLKSTLQQGNQQLREAVQQLNQERLDEPILPGMPSVYITVQGVVQHDLYHAGQIAILKKALMEVSGYE